MNIFAGYSSHYDENARLTILRALAAQPDGRLNDGVLIKELQAFGINRGRDYLHQQLDWLETNAQAVKLRRVETVIIAELTEAGEDHVEKRRVLPGIVRPSRTRG
ncbi:hypothetical protein FP2506_11487 [Fulvimarina pelagi HTCC2506]|uniref:Uncharacterized protein n=1 Tax=Fulvimarina pelagi HTCC2506 TaxID=314231 RepID=Q0FYY2_9HYPH|nr:hypothetical protein [Fulvimarina pelagi]EAU40176.1 hypothetical protein FP2506_11487 [Fulvimarina pelagi HTCC2506]